MAASDEIIFPSLAFFLGAIGLILSYVANFYCGYVTTDVTITDPVNNTTSNPFPWRSGLWNFEDHDIYYVFSSNQFYFVRYYYCVPWSAHTRVEQDANWTAAQVFSVISVVLGSMTAIWTCCFLCADAAQMSRVWIFNIGVIYLAIVVCQGLTFLYFPSKACQNGTAIATHGNQEYQLDWNGCNRSSGANCSIASMVFYFVSSLLVFSAVSMSSMMDDNTRNANSAVRGRETKSGGQQRQED